MAIVCRECSCVISKTEVIGHGLGDLYTFMKKFTLLYFSRRSYSEDLLFSLANRQKIDCPVCFSYEGWVKSDQVS